MFFPKTEFCPFNSDEYPRIIKDDIIKNASDSEISRNDMETSPEYDTKCELMKKIQETSFAVVDLNLFLDTHPDCEQALELFESIPGFSDSEEKIAFCRSKIDEIKMAEENKKQASLSAVP